jgi:hypothetical protein
MEYKEKKINKRVPLVLTYHPSLEKISGIVHHHWKEIEKSETLAKMLPEPPVVAFRRLKSIKDTLVRAAVSRPSSRVDQCKPCGDKRCKCCLQLQHAQAFHSKRLFRKVTSVSIHSFVEWLDTFSYVLRPADVTVKEVNQIRRCAIDIAKDLILLSCHLTMECLCVLQ